MTVRSPGPGFPQDLPYGTLINQARYTMDHGAVVGITRIGSLTTSKKGVRVSIKKGLYPSYTIAVLT